MATVRRVRRIIRKIDPWTALKVSAVVWAVLALALVLGGVIFWSVLERAGLPQRLTEFMVEITLIDEGAQPFDIEARRMSPRRRHRTTARCPRPSANGSAPLKFSLTCSIGSQHERHRRIALQAVAP